MSWYHLFNHITLHIKIRPWLDKTCVNSIFNFTNIKRYFTSYQHWSRKNEYDYLKNLDDYLRILKLFSLQLNK